MVIIESYSVAVLMCIITMICWGSWANTQKLASEGMAISAFLLGLLPRRAATHADLRIHARQHGRPWAQRSWPT